jgi:hypothetical protein
MDWRSRLGAAVAGRLPSEHRTQSSSSRSFHARAARAQVSQTRGFRSTPSSANVAWMEPHRARELLAAERDRIERALTRLGHQDTGEPADEEDPANLASELYQDEFDQGLADDLREELPPSSGPRRGLPQAPTASRSKVESRYRTSVSRLFRQPSGRSKRKRTDRARAMTRGLVPPAQTARLCSC